MGKYVARKTATSLIPQIITVDLLNRID